MFLVNCTGIILQNRLHQHHTQTQILQNLHLTDILSSLHILIICIFMYTHVDDYISVSEWPANTACMFASIALLTSEMLSAYTIVILSISNLIITKYALKMQSLTARKTKILLTSGWCISILVSFTVTFNHSSQSVVCFIDLTPRKIVSIILCIGIITLRITIIWIHIIIYKYVLHVSKRFESLSRSRHHFLFQHLVSVTSTEILSIVLFFVINISYTILSANDALHIYLIIILLKIVIISICHNFTFLYQKLFKKHTKDKKTK